MIIDVALALFFKLMEPNRDYRCRFSLIFKINGTQ
jgi:hypothetical protein